MIPKNGFDGNRAGFRGFIGGHTKAEALAIPVIVVLVGLAAFGLGRLSATNSSSEGLIIPNNVQVVASTTPDTSSDTD